MSTHADEHLQDSLGRLTSIVKSLFVEGEGLPFGSLAFESETQWLLGDVYLNHIYPECRAIAGSGLLGSALICPVTFYSHLMYRSVGGDYVPLQPLLWDPQSNILLGQGLHIPPLTKVCVLAGALNTAKDGLEVLQLIDALNGGGYSVAQVLALIIPDEEAADAILQADYSVDQIIPMEGLFDAVQEPSPILSL